MEVKHEGDARSRRKRRNRLIVAAFFIFLALIIMLESPLTRVRQVIVSGNRAIPTSDILRVASLQKGMSVWQINAHHVNHVLQLHEPMIQSIVVHVDYLHGVVRLQIYQKHVVAILDAKGQFYRLLDDGDVYGKISAAAGFAWPIVSADALQVPTDGIPPNDNVALLCQQLTHVSPRLLTEISELHVDSFGTVTVYMNDTFAILCKVERFAAQIGTGLVALQYFVSQGYKPGFVDVTGQAPYQYSPFTHLGKVAHT